MKGSLYGSYLLLRSSEIVALPWTKICAEFCEDNLLNKKVFNINTEFWPINYIL